ncbi:MAG: Rpn family recombination-promoting nuclease/putative transposase [Bacteroidales bacterium]|nr:Rpn family recombination-promoting nuclease/putative transposase [Bacteroidales bacterium]
MTKEKSQNKVKKLSEARKVEPAPVYINPLTDFGVKKLFCNDRRGAERLLSLLRTFLPDKMEGVTSITFLPTELLGDTEDIKRVTLDIYGVTNDRKHVIVEMQRVQQSFFNNRAITYNCRVISQNVERGDMEYNIPMTISFCILDFLPTWFKGCENGNYFHVVQFKDEHNEVFSDRMIFCFLELSKFAASKPGQLKDMEFPDDKHKWAYILKNMGQMEVQDLSQEDEVFRGLFEDGKYAKLTVMEKKKYKKSVLEYADVQDAIRCAQENSLKEGIEQGRAEKERQIVLSLIANGFDTPTIIRITGLTEEEVLAAQR